MEVLLYSFPQQSSLNIIQNILDIILNLSVFFIKTANECTTEESLAWTKSEFLQNYELHLEYCMKDKVLLNSSLPYRLK